MQKEHLFTHAGMPGVKGHLRGPIVGTITAFMRAIEKHRVVSGAGDYGALTVYRDDKGALRAHRSVRFMTCATFGGKTKKELREFIRAELPKCREMD